MTPEEHKKWKEEKNQPQEIIMIDTPPGPQKLQVDAGSGIQEIKAPTSTANEEEQQQPEPEAKKEEQPKQEEPSNKNDPYAKFRDGDGEIDYEKLANSYAEAEKDRSRLADQLGETRSELYEVLKSQTRKSVENKTEQGETSDDDNFFTDPGKAVQEKIDQALKPYKDRELKDQMTKFAADYHDFAVALNTDDFMEWVESSPVRRNLYIKADASTDEQSIQYAVELAELWRAHHPVQQDPTPESPAKPNGQAKQSKQSPAVGGGERSHGASSVTSAPDQKVWTMSEIVQIKIHNPSRAKQLEYEWDQAFEQGRVKRL